MIYLEISFMNLCKLVWKVTILNSILLILLICLFTVIQILGMV